MMDKGILEIGKKFVFNGDTIEVVESPDCSCAGCYLENLERYCHERIFGNCYYSSRSDNKNVIFKLVKE